MLASKPIDAHIATKAARAIFEAGIRTPASVLDTERATMIAAFGRAHYARYDESSATRLTEIAETVHAQYGDDLRGLAEEGGHEVTATKRLLKQFKGIGDTGADIFLREVQDVWPWIRPYLDDRALETAGHLGLPVDAQELAALAPDSTAELASALVRVSADDGLFDRVAPPQ
jgi:hypothetical protein